MYFSGLRENIASSDVRRQELCEISDHVARDGICFACDDFFHVIVFTDISHGHEGIKIA